MPKVKAVLFDLDGTLRDTRDLIHDALDHTFRTHGLRVPSHEELKPYIHHHSFVQKQFAPNISLEAFEATYGAQIDELLPYVQLYKDVEEVMRSVHEQHKTAVVTAGKSAPREIPRYGLAPYVDVIVSANDITKHKPDPEGVNLALERLGVAPSHAILIGDLATDIQAAKRAGLATTVGITHGFGSRDSLKKAGADYIIDSLAELPVALEAIEKA